MLKVKIMNDMQTNSIPGLFIVCNSMSDPIIFFAGTEEKRVQMDHTKSTMCIFLGKILLKRAHFRKWLKMTKNHHS